MRRSLLAAAGLALLIPAALAQTALAQTPPAPPQGAAPAGQPNGPGPGPGPLAGGPALPPPPPGGRGPGGPGTMAPPPPPRGAHFRLERGDARIDVKCADEDSTRACADVVSGLLDKLAALPAPARN